MFLATALVILFSPHQLAFAHTGLVSSTPASGAVVETLPTEITLEFSENILVLSGKQTSSIEVVAPNGDHLESGQLAVSGRILSIGLAPSQQEGEFRVVWRAVAQDGHPVEGVYVFSKASENSPTPTPTPTPGVSITAESEVSKSNSASIIEIGLGGLAVLIGLAFLVLRWRRNSSD